MAKFLKKCLMAGLMEAEPQEGRDKFRRSRSVSVVCACCGEETKKFKAHHRPSTAKKGTDASRKGGMFKLCLACYDKQLESEGYEIRTLSRYTLKNGFRTIYGYVHKHTGAVKSRFSETCTTS